MNETDSRLIRQLIMREFNSGKMDTLVALRLMRAVEDVTVKTDKEPENG